MIASWRNPMKATSADVGGGDLGNRATGRRVKPITANDGQEQEWVAEAASSGRWAEGLEQEGPTHMGVVRRSDRGCVCGDPNRPR